MSNLFKKKFLASALLISLLLTSLLVGCTGRTVIDVNIDPETGEGDIVIDPVVQPTDDGSGGNTDSGTSSSPEMSQFALFAVILAFFVGVIAIVIAVSRRPSSQDPPSQD